MFSVGFSEIIVVVIVSVLALKPAQMVHAVKICRKLLADWRAWRVDFDAEQLRLEKELALAERTKLAAAVSDVSDLLETDKEKSHE